MTLLERVVRWWRRRRHRAAVRRLAKEGREFRKAVAWNQPGDDPADVFDQPDHDELLRSEATPSDDSTCQWTGCTSEITNDPSGIHCDSHVAEIAARKQGMD